MECRKNEAEEAEEADEAEEAEEAEEMQEKEKAEKGGDEDDDREEEREDEDSIAQEEQQRRQLNRKISRKEVNQAIDNLKNQRAAGQDGIIGDVLKKGGEEIRKAVYTLCCENWRMEEIPREWMQGLIFPLYKDGDDRDPLNYRGITLLSIVGKVYNRVLGDRLMKFAERKGGVLEELGIRPGIVEEQGGFRPGRGTIDQLFVLTEILKSRVGMSTYAAFIDVKKAYDTVWRQGLWKRLWDEGVRGKMWRVVKSMYSTVQSAVLIGDEKTEWFELYTGVRQGCVMSPILFSLFVNGLAREIKAVGKGVQVGRQKVQLLLYADDIVLISDTQKDLQSMLDCVTEYSRKWRFRVNPKKGKSEVMRFGKTRRSQIKWMLGGKEIYETAQYKYLGVEINKGIQFKALKERLLRSARRRMMTVWGMGMRRGEMPVSDCVRVWQTLVRPALEYGAAVWGECVWEEAERIQREMARMILKCSPKMTNEAVLGELGWWTLKGRRDLLRLKYYGKIVRMGEDRLVKQVYVESRKRLEEGKQSKWCADTKAILHWHGGSMDQAAVDHRRTQAMEQTSLEGNQSEGRTTVERTYDAENKAENIPNYQTDADIRTILEQQRQAGETDDDEIERRNE
ncbi:MAG: RNA-directed DNA polymerase [Bacteroidota bacterium]